MEQDVADGTDSGTDEPGGEKTEHGEPFQVIAEVGKIPAPKDGASIRAGDGPPLFVGKEGDLYLDLKTGDLYKAS